MTVVGVPPEKVPNPESEVRANVNEVIRWWTERAERVREQARRNWAALATQENRA